MRQLIRKHPLTSLLIAALLLRLLAAVFSKGYMASDDHFETVRIAYLWLRDGMFSENGLLTWGNNQPGDIARFPLYNLLLYLVMKANLLVGITSLDSMMYSIRVIHGLLSLMGVWAVYRTIELATGTKKWAAIGGALVAFHMLMPFLAVRNLIEIAGGHLWVVAIYLLYRFREDNNNRWVLAAGIITGLAWMIRFEMIFAAWIVPMILWWETRKFKPAVTYSIAFLTMTLISGLVDLALLGKFMGSTMHHIGQILTESPPFDTTIVIYAGVLLAYFIPPFSLMAFYLAAARKLWIEHKLPIITTVSFVVAHTLSPSRQERYMIPIALVLIVIIVLGLRNHFNARGYFATHPVAFRAIAIPSIVINIAGLAVFTFNYSHKDVVEPLVWAERQMDSSIGEDIVREEPPASVVFFSPERGRIYPMTYGGFTEINRIWITRWSDMTRLEATLSLEDDDRLFILYPPAPDDLPRFVDSLSSRVGPVRKVLTVKPSLVDDLAHRLNPDHNPSRHAWVYRKSDMTGVQ